MPTAGLILQEKLNANTLCSISADNLVVEEVRYDYEEFPRYADDFIKDLLRLMIISKLNSTARNSVSRANFQNLVSQIDGCESYVVKYGQPLLYAKYHGMAFTDQKVMTQFIRRKQVIDVTMESVFGEFVKTFDSLASKSKSKVKWGVSAYKDKQADPLFGLLNLFVDAVSKLTALDPASNPADSLASKKFAIRNASITHKSLHLEFLIDGQLNILELNPSKRKEHAIKVLFSKSEEHAKAIAALMIQ